MNKQNKPINMETLVSLGTMLVVLLGAFTLRYAIYLPQYLH